MNDSFSSEVAIEGVPRQAFVDALANELAVSAATLAPTIAIDAHKVGVVADTHCVAPDGSDLPDTVIDALIGCDLILHCGDLSAVAVLERLSTLAPVLSVRSRIDPPSDGVRLHDGPLLIRAGHTLIGMSADIPANMEPAELFGTDVDLALSGTSHVPQVSRIGRTLLVNPGSPTIPLSDSGPTLATIDLDGVRSSVHIVHLARRRS
ncbi:MAG TPA: metallophosphoesterase family protein [Ilumatobacteraceae bacterium]|nr:metallophosphoesterase family protein [Ilumatobacteraceae bacterium]